MLQKVCCSALKDSKCYVQTFLTPKAAGNSTAAIYQAGLSSTGSKAVTLQV